MVKKAKNKEILIKVICLLLSIGLWLYINSIENPVSERVITNIPVEILNTQVLAEDGLALAPNQNISISLTVSGPTGEIYKINKSQFRIVADLVSYGLKPGENNIPINILNSPSGINIKNNYPRVELNLENLQKKTMPIYSEINVQNAKNTKVQNVKISPLSASVEGAESLVKEVSKLVVQGQVNDVNQSTVLNLPIVAVNSSGVQIKGLTITPSQADVAINLEQGKAVPIKVTTEGTLPSNLVLKSMTPNITSIDIVGNGSDKLSSLSTTPIDLSKITGNATIPVTITLPPGIVNISGSDTVNVNVVVQNNTTTKTVSLPINMIGQKEGYTYKLAQNTAEVTFAGSAKDIGALDMNQLSCQVDTSTLDKTGLVPITVVGGNLEGIDVKVNPTTIQVDMTGENKPPVTGEPDNPTPPTSNPNPTPTPSTKPKPDAGTGTNPEPAPNPVEKPVNKSEASTSGDTDKNSTNQNKTSATNSPNSASTANTQANPQANNTESVSTTKDKSSTVVTTNMAKN
ncbi:MAG: CdaR family protein [Sarcina sp.]